jgi:hypothetical protein
VTVQEVTMYRVVCNRCGYSAQDGSDYYAWIEPGQAVDDADGDDWLIRDDGHWCRDCVVFDDGLDAYIPKPALKPEGAP